MVRRVLRSGVVNPRTEQALLSFFADVDTLFSESSNPLGRDLPPETALRVTRGNLGQIRRWWDAARREISEVES